MSQPASAAFCLSLQTPDLVGLREVLRTSGAFFVADHGVDPALLEAGFTAMRALCALPEPARMRCAAAELPAMRGYTPLRDDGDQRESFFWTTGLDERADAWPIPGTQPWPDELPDLQRAAQALSEPLRRATERSLGLALAALGLPDAAAASWLRAPGGLGLRLLRYPPASGRRDGVTPHSDRPPLTLIAQNSVDGLQWASRDANGRPSVWHDLRPEPGWLIAQVGDALAEWSNDVAVANIHRVCNHSQTDRYSLASFALPHPDTLLAPWPACGSPAHDPIRFGKYLRDWLDSLRGEHIYQPQRGQ